jgi:hypothetical protein
VERSEPYRAEARAFAAQPHLASVSHAGDRLALDRNLKLMRLHK